MMYQGEIDIRCDSATSEGHFMTQAVCAFVLLFLNGSFVEYNALIGCYFPSDNFSIREIPEIPQCIQGDN